MQQREGGGRNPIAFALCIGRGHRRWTAHGPTTLTATSDSDGDARATYKLGKDKGAVGQYALRADATLGGNSATASASFSVR
jgi:hypothetical protein